MPSSRKAAAEDETRSLETLVAVRLVRIAEVISRLATQTIEARFGLRNTDLRIMNMLDQTEGVTVNEIARRAHIDSAWISRSIRHLETEGLLTRRAHPRDSRLRIVALTDKGAMLLDEVRPVALARELRLLEGIDAPAFRDGLAQLLSNAEAMLDDGEG